MELEYPEIEIFNYDINNLESDEEIIEVKSFYDYKEQIRYFLYITNKDKMIVVKIKEYENETCI